MKISLAAVITLVASCAYTAEAQTYLKLRDTACGFGGGGVQGYDYDRIQPSTDHHCRAQCDAWGKWWCYGYDFDYDINRCRIFFRFPSDAKYKDDVYCWLYRF